MNTNNVQTQPELDVSQRICYYEQALQQISAPSSFREMVLRNVYQCLVSNYRTQSQTASIGLRP